MRETLDITQFLLRKDPIVNEYRMQQDPLEINYLINGKVARCYNPRSNLLDYYFHRGMIDESQHQSGIKYHHLWLRGTKLNAITSRFSQRLGGKYDYEYLMEGWREFNNATQSIGNLYAKLATLGVCCIGFWASALEGNGKIPKRHSMTYLKQGLNDLTQHFVG